MKIARLKPWIWIALLILLAGGGYFAWTTYRAKPDPAERYQTEAVDLGDIRQGVSANGTLNPVVLVNVGTQVSGTVKALHADFNDHVEKGQVLMELDDSLLRAQLAQSSANLSSNQAALNLARANAERMRSLFKQEYISRQELDQAVQNLRAAEAAVIVSQGQVQRDRTNLGYAVIRSPVSGIVMSREVDSGQTVAASFQTPTLFKIAQDLRKMQIDSSFAEADVGQIKQGQPAAFRVDAFPDLQFKGEVRQVRLNPTTQSNVVTYNVVVSVDNPEQILLPGMTAYVNVLTAERNDVLRVPNTALRFKPQPTEKGGAGAISGPRRQGQGGQGAPGGRARGGQGPRTALYVMRAGRLQRIPVVTGISDGRYTEIVRGDVKAGDRVVTEDLQADGKKSAGSAGNAPGSGNFRMRMF